MGGPGRETGRAPGRRAGPPPKSLLPLPFQEKLRVPTGPRARCLQGPQGTCTPACVPARPHQALPALSSACERAVRAPLLTSSTSPLPQRGQQSPWKREQSGQVRCLAVVLGCMISFDSQVYRWESRVSESLSGLPGPQRIWAWRGPILNPGPSPPVLSCVG